MYKDNLKFLYSEYRACLRQQFEDYLGRDDQYISYRDKCDAQKTDIKNYYSGIYLKAENSHPKYERQLDIDVDKAYLRFNEYGWTGKQVRNL